MPKLPITLPAQASELDPSVRDVPRSGTAPTLGLTEQGTDVDELAFVVMQEAADAEQADLQGIMAETDVETKQKQALREVWDATTTKAAQTAATSGPGEERKP